MTSLLAFELTALLVGCGLAGTLAVLRATLPRASRRADAAAQARGALRRFLLGLLNGPALFVLAIALGSRPDTKVLAVLVLTILIALALWGLLAAAPRLGRRILELSAGAPDSSELRQTLTGAAALAAVSLLPWAGWLIAGASLLLAIGTGVSAVFLRRPPGDSA